MKFDDLVIFFGQSSCSKVRIGEIIGGKFIPNIQIIEETAENITKEIKYDNSKFDFVDEFINIIMDYKIKNQKSSISSEDMCKILELYGITYDSELNKLISTLKATSEKIKVKTI